MGFATDKQVEAFLEATPEFERMLVEDGLLLLKYWLTCDQEEQEQRFAERHDDPTKQWKISPIDVAARGKYRDYTKAREAMLEATHTRHAPWTLVDFNDQRRIGRIDRWCAICWTDCRSSRWSRGCPHCRCSVNLPEGTLRGHQTAAFVSRHLTFVRSRCTTTGARLCGVATLPPAFASSAQKISGQSHGQAHYRQDPPWPRPPTPASPT
jgi:hypothetical protein